MAIEATVLVERVSVEQRVAGHLPLHDLSQRQMPLPIFIAVGSSAIPSLLLSFIVWPEQTSSPHPSIHLLFPHLLLRTTLRDKMRHTSKQQFSFNINMFNVEVFEQIALEYRHNTAKQKQGCEPVLGPRIKRAQPDFSPGTGGLGKCQKYFTEMWGESQD
ncbi:hypothetical protein AKJ16_DCAP22835 [Drosera capensis]